MICVHLLLMGTVTQFTLQRAILSVLLTRSHATCNTSFYLRRMGNVENKEISNKLIEIGPNLWNIRGDFTAFKIFEVGTHMSIVKLENGKFLFIDTIPLEETLKIEIDAFTNNGELIEAIIATHPFHTIFFPDFYKAYPNADYYGTPRHIRNFPNIPWKGDISTCQNLNRWSPFVQMRIPAGSEFNNPKPEAMNHFSCVWCFVPSARAIHVDDTVGYYTDPSVSLKLVGVKKNTLQFHTSMDGPGLLPTPEAPQLFKAWVFAIIDEWDFDIICCAHKSNVLSGAKEMLTECLNKAIPLLDKLSKENAKGRVDDKKKEEAFKKTNISGNECG